MKFYKLAAVAALLVAAISSTAFSEEITKECIAQSEMQDIAKHFTQFKSIANADFCNDGSHTWHLLSSLMFMRKTEFSADMQPSKDELFTGRFAKDWYGYFIGRINDLQIEDGCQKGVIAYVYMWGNTMYVCPMALTNAFSSLDRASVMMHEARHIDGFPHITCSRGARKGLQGACDDKIAKGGSYAVTVETYAQLSKFAQGIHPAMRAYAKSSAIIYADEAFETPVKIARSERLLALTNTLDFNAIDTQTNEVTMLGKAQTAGHIFRRGQHMALMPSDKTQNIQYVFAENEGTISQAPGGDFIAEYNEQTAEQKSNLVDLHIGAQWSVKLQKTKATLACDPRSPAKTDINLPAGLTATGFIYPDGYARDRYTVLVATEQGQLLEASCINKTAAIKVSNVKLDQNYSRIHKANGMVYGLAIDGNLFALDAAKGMSTKISTILDGTIVDIVPQERFEFFQ